jgi:predicted RNase H-like nuclease
MPWIAGVDGCHAGWIVVLVEHQAPQPGRHAIRLCAGFDQVLALEPAPMLIAIDMPIGLLDQPCPGGRACDRQARRLLGRRASSVFSPPSRPILEATQYEQVRGHGMSRQAFGIMPKIRQIDRLMTPARQQVVYEAHPELAFMALAGHPMHHNKKTFAGREERWQALRSAPEVPVRPVEEAFEPALHRFKRTQVAPDDLLDAYVLTRTAYRIASAQACCLPANPPVDTRGLRMAIWY